MNYDLIKKLSEARGAIVTSMQELLEENGKGLTGEQSSQWGRMDAEQEALALRIANLKRADELEAEMRKPEPIDLPTIGRTSDPEAHGRTASRGGEVWRDARTGREVRVLRGSDRCASEEERGNYSGLTIGGFLRSMIVGEGRTDVEKRALSEGTDSAGGFAVPDILTRRIIDRLRSESVVFRAGAATVMLESDITKIARLATGPTAAWRSENAEITASDATFEGVTFTARSLALLLKCSRELLEDASNMEVALETEFARNLAAEMDRVVLVGSGTPPEPKGIAFITGIGSVTMGAGGAALTNQTAYPKLLDAVYEILRDNAPAPTAAIMNPRTEVAFSKLLDSTYQPLRRPPMIETLPFLSTTGIPITDATDASPETTNGSKVLVGYFPHALVGIRSSLRIEILKERFAEFLQYGFVAHVRMDVQVEHAESFAELHHIIP